MPRLWTKTALALVFAAAASCAPQPPDQAICPPALADMPTPDTLAALRAAAEAHGAVRVIVQVAAASAQPAAGNVMDAALNTFAAAGVDYAARLNERLPWIVAEVTAAELDTLYPNPQFSTWTEDRIAFATLADSAPLVQAPQVWALGGRGGGQAVAILDTGVDAAHPFLAGRIVAEACFSTTSAVNNSSTTCPNGQSSQIAAGAARPCNAAGCEHGTHVAGIAAGRGADFSGIAPDADIIAVQVFSTFRGAACGERGGTCVASFASDQIRALDFVLQQAGQRAVAAVNMSLGGGRSTTACDTDLTKTVIDQLRAAGVATVIASGNDGFRDAVSFPGCISTAITVGATTKQDRVATFSNCGPQVDLHAPGAAINSSVPGGRFARFDGTSMATPHVAGAFASLRSLDTEASVDQIETALESSGLDVGGRPRIRLLDAATTLGGAPTAEAAMNTSGDADQIAAELAALPQDQPVRLIVGVAAPAGAQGQTLDAALARAETAAQQAGASYVGRMGAQPMLAIEATPAQARALIASGAVTSVQIDRPARTQD
jgi:subtilisin family serine protease